MGAVASVLWVDHLLPEERKETIRRLRGNLPRQRPLGL